MLFSRNQKLYFYLPLFFILCPTFPNIISIGDQIVFAIEALVVLFLYKLYGFSFPCNNPAFSIFTYFFFCIAIDICFDLINGVFTFSDSLELFRPIGFILFYYFYNQSFVSIEYIEKQTIRAINLIFILLAIYSVVEFFFLEQILSISYLLYKREALPVLRDKAIGSFSQIYSYGYILILPLSFFLIKFFKQKRIINFVLLGIVFFALLLTQSKSVYISAALAILLCFCIVCFCTTSKDKWNNFLILILIVIVVIYYFLRYQEELYDTFAYASYGLEAIASGEGGTVHSRLEQIQWAIDNNSLIFVGNGIGKGDIKQDGLYALESLYGLYYYRYGLIGLFLFVGIVLYTSFCAFRIAKVVQYNLKLSAFYYGLSIFYIITPIALSSSCHQDTPKISFLFYGLMGLIHARYKSIGHRKNAILSYLKKIR